MEVKKSGEENEKEKGSKLMIHFVFLSLNWKGSKWKTKGTKLLLFPS